MTQYAIVTDLNRCVGCLACSAACKIINGVAPGSFWNKVLRVGPNPKEGGSGQWPDVEMYFLPLQCQHCKEPECVKVCPTAASHKLDDGTVQIDKTKCIGCQFCVMACPYGVRYLNEDEGVVEKCTLCEQRIVEGLLPNCVAQCGARARFFGDLEQGIESFTAHYTVDITEGDNSYERTLNSSATAGDVLLPWEESEVYTLPDYGNGPQIQYILRDRKWQGEE